MTSHFSLSEQLETFAMKAFAAGMASVSDKRFAELSCGEAADPAALLPGRRQQ
jgi:hypothetical protein